MTADAQAILEQLALVERERTARTADTALGDSVQRLKSYQQRRFARTYADLLASARYAAAARFFLDELYGPKDFSQRDAQFARVVPALVRLFPQELVETVALLARLHALSESLDSEMGRHLVGRPLERATYAQAWQHTGRPDAREEQIRLTLAVERDVGHVTFGRGVRFAGVRARSAVVGRRWRGQCAGVGSGLRQDPSRRAT